MKNALFLAMAITLAGMISCKKTEQTPAPDPGPTIPAGSRLDLLRDSVYLFSKEVYLWNDVIPEYNVFNPRKYSGSTELESAQKVMAGIRDLQQYDKKRAYSFVTTQEASDQIQTGEDKDYGFFIKAATFEKAQPVDSVRWYVQYVYKSSPAGLAGVERGWYISKINNTNIGYNNSSVTLLNDLFFGNLATATITFVKPDGSEISKDLTRGSFTSNSVLLADVITNGSKKTGYLVFNQFFGAVSRTELREAITDFSSKGVNELVVDLRYNHGGSTETQNVLANLIVPSSANGKKMYTYVFNDSLVAGKFPLLKKKPGFSNITFAPEPNSVNFGKEGSLNLSRVFFIVSGESASASELLINNLRPYMDVKLIGDTTYGKPVGFFPISVYNYAVYPISFKTVNSAGNAEYFDGFAPDHLAPDGVNKNWGDVTEPSLAAALRYINTGSFRRGYDIDDHNRKMLSQQKELQPLNSVLYDNKFTGMYTEKSKR